MSETTDATRRRDERLRELLRAADPVAGGSAEQEEAALRRIGARLTAAAAEARPRRAWAPIAAFALLLAVALLAPLVRDRRPAPEATSASGTSRSAPMPSVGRQQLQFETPGGTRLIWVLDPAFSLTPEP